MKQILIAKSFLLLGLALSASPSFGDSVRSPSNTSGGTFAAEAVYQDFLQKTGMDLGEYRAVSGSSESCQEGDLHVLKLEDSLTLMLGSHPLITNLGNEPDRDEDRGCVTELSANYTAGQASGVRIENSCDGMPRARYDVVVRFKKGAIEYQRKVTEDGRVIIREHCKLVRQ